MESVTRNPSLTEHGLPVTENMARISDGERAVSKVVEECKQRGGLFVGVERVGGGEIGYRQIRETTVAELSEEFNINGEAINEWFEKSFEAAEELYDFARNNKPERSNEDNFLDEPLYHNMNHIEMVMTNTLVAFLAIKRAEVNFEDLTNSQKDLVEIGYGREAIASMGEAELKSLLTYQAFHEAGEWWPRMVKLDKIEDYKRINQDLFNELRREGVDVPVIGDWVVKIRPERIVPDGSKLVDSTVPIGMVESGSLGKLLELVGKQKGGSSLNVEEMGLNAGGDYADTKDGRVWVEFGFNVTMAQSADISSEAKDDASFTKARRDGGLLGEAEAMSVALGRLAVSADLAQVLDAKYSEEVEVIKKDGTRVSVSKSGLLLFAEFGRFMPHGKGMWHRPEDIAMGDFFCRTLVAKNSIQPELAEIWNKHKPGIAVDYEYLYNKVMAMGGVNVRAGRVTM